jgi:hypothetical protein
MAEGRKGYCQQNRGDIPGQELGDAVDRMFGDAAEHVAQISFWVLSNSWPIHTNASPAIGALVAT